MFGDPFAQIKAAQKEGWALFAPFENITIGAAGKLVNFAEVRAGQKVLDVACGTGVVAITASRKGAQVKAQDLSPTLIERAKANANVAEQEIEFVVGDVEALPYRNGEFDVVLSQYGHMFAPRPEVALSEMLRVLKPGGRIAFSTWPPEHFTGMMFALTAKYAPPPADVPPLGLWGEPRVIAERLGKSVTDLVFDRAILAAPAISPKHFCHLLQTHLGPLAKLSEKLKANPAELQKFESELLALTSPVFKDNFVLQQYLMTRANKAA